MVAVVSAQGPVGDETTFRQQIRPFLIKHCADCHGEDAQEGELRLDTLPADFLSRQPAAKWIEVLDRLNLGEMPPADEPRPDPKQLLAVTDWILAELARVRALADSTGGRVLLRRLTRTEYTHTVRDLLKVTFIEGEGPMDLLPPDGSIQGFNKVSKGLLLDPSLMESYFAAAEFVASRALATRPPKVPTRTLRYEFEDTASNQAIRYELDARTRWLERGGVTMTEGNARTFARLLHPFNDKQTPVDGEYLIRVKAGADPGDRGEPIYMDVTKGATGVLARIRVDAPIDQPKVYEFRRVLDAAVGGEFGVSIVDGTRASKENTIGREVRQEIDELIQQGKQKDAFRLRARRRAEGAYDTYTRTYLSQEVLDLSKTPKLHLDYIEVEGPLNGRWPPESREWLLADALEGDRWKLGEQSADGLSRDEMLKAASAVFGKVLPRAYRRSVRKQEAAAIVELVASELDNGQPFDEAIKVGLIAVLCSPDFLYLFEPMDAVAARGDVRDFRDRKGRVLRGRVLTVTGDKFVFERDSDKRRFELSGEMLSPKDQAYLAELQQRPAGKSKVRPLTDFEYASRLSYFLWSSMPDEQLYRVAGNGKLRSQQDITAQIDRMLADPRAEALVTDFASQWLRIAEFDRFAPDERIFPEYYRSEYLGIGDEIRTEPLAFFREVLNKNESVLSFLDSDWTMLNERLASYYGIDGVQGKEFRRVAIPVGSPRGGLLGMAGVHKWGSDGNRTKPVERGKYALDVLFNDPPPPPPPNAGEVEPNVRGENLTVRERLAKHRHVATCANCHRRIDPYGLALENFNVIGKWRDKQDGEKPISHWGDNRREIDASGVMPNGDEFANFAEFKTALGEQSDRFLRGLSEKMFLYALGRTIEPGDRETINRCVASLKADDHTLRSLIRTIALSEQFRTK